jgi:hypothetical protein
MRSEETACLLPRPQLIVRYMQKKLKICRMHHVWKPSHAHTCTFRALEVIHHPSAISAFLISISSVHVSPNVMLLRAIIWMMLEMLYGI